MKFEKKRFDMVKNDIEKRGIKNIKILEAFLKVPREEFILEKFKSHSYNDNPLPINENQTISQPYIVALMIDALELNNTKEVLEIGTGSGYQTAILAEICYKVYTIERHEKLLNKAKKTLEYLGYNNIEYKLGNGIKGWNKEKLFDGIIVSAAAKNIPEILINQLKSHGKLIIPVGNSFYQELILIKKTEEGLIRSNLGGCRFVELVDDEK